MYNVFSLMFYMYFCDYFNKCNVSVIHFLLRSSSSQEEAPDMELVLRVARRCLELRRPDRCLWRYCSFKDV